MGDSNTQWKEHQSRVVQQASNNRDFPLDQDQFIVACA